MDKKMSIIILILYILFSNTNTLAVAPASVYTVTNDNVCLSFIHSFPFTCNAKFVFIPSNNMRTNCDGWFNKTNNTIYINKDVDILVVAAHEIGHWIDIHHMPSERDYSLKKDFIALFNTYSKVYSSCAPGRGRNESDKPYYYIVWSQEFFAQTFSDFMCCSCKFTSKYPEIANYFRKLLSNIK